jgi:Derlin-2/3
MPPRVQNVNGVGAGVEAWFTSLPPMTRTFAVIIFTVTILFRFQLLNLMYIALIWPRVVSHFEVCALQTVVLPGKGRKAT